MSNNKVKNPAGKALPAETKSPAKPVEAKAPSAPASAAKPAPAKAPTSPPAVRPPVPSLFRRIDWFTFAITTLVVFVGYWWTLAPDLTLEDSGELAVGSMYAGVPHPPGYPVWTIYTWLFTVLVPVSNIAYRVGLSSAVAGALGCGLVGLMVSRGSSMMIEGIADLKNLERRWEDGLCVVSGFVAGMLIAFNGFMWSQAVIVEVYTLSVLSLAGVLLCLMRWIYAPYQYRYLYMAFFWFGICFNNHQSLLVVALGLEIAVIVTQPRLGRDLLFWNIICYLGGLIGVQMDLISVLKDNTPLLIIYHVIGVVSFMVWLFLLFRTKIRGVELARDFTMVLSVLYLALVFGTITHYSLVFYYTDGTTLKGGPLILCSLFGLACMGVFGYLIKTTNKLGHEWRYALICGVCFAVGAAFYLYMPLASMSNPPLNWGYPRTVTGFFHAFTRGQYERIHPTTSPGKFVEQIGMYIAGATEEFNLAYLAIGLLPFFFYRRMQPRERAWLIGLTGIYLLLSFFLLLLLNPAPDRQSRDLNKVFFTASHVMIAMGIGYGLTLVGAQLALQYERFRKWGLVACAVISGVALFVFFDTIWQTPNPIAWLSHLFASKGTWEFPNPVIVYTALYGVVLAVGATAIFFVGRTRMPLRAFMALAALMPIYSIMSHWEENEQRGHLFGYWFGHDMFTPPFNGPDGKPLYPEMTRDTVLFGGTDPGRFNPTYMIYCESFIPPSKKPRDPNFDRRDVYLITQNALADGTYLNYIRAHYNRGTQYDPPFFSELLRGPKEQALNVETNFIARMMIPIDRFFLDLGDRIEKNRRVGSSFFKQSDFLNLPALVAKLKPGPQQSPLAKYLYDNLSKNTQSLLSAGGDARALGRALAKDFNVILEQQIEQDPAKRKLLYDPGRFEGVELSPRTQRFARQVQGIYADLATYPNQNVHTPIRLARQLLEEAYPKEIAKSLGGVYPELEIRTPSAEDSQRCFTEYLNDAQRRLDHDRRAPNEPKQIKPGEDVRIIDNRVQVSGQVAVMAINALLTRVIFDANPDHEFFVEESFPLEWMYPYLSPFGIIMKINRNILPELTDEMVRKDHDFWSQFSQRLIGNWITYDTSVSNLCTFAERVYYRRNYEAFKGDPAFVRDNDGQKAFSKLRSSIAGVYAWRISNSKSPVEQQRMIKEAEFAFKQAYAFCPYSPEAIFRYINLLIGFGRVDDALQLAATSRKLDPNNGQLENLVFELQRIKQQQQQSAAGHVQSEATPAPGQSQALVAQLEQQLRAQPGNMTVAIQLITAYIQNQQSDRALALVDQIVGSPSADANMLVFAAQVYQQLNNLPKLEQTLAKMVKLSPDNPEAWFDLAGIQALINMPSQAVVSLDESLTRSAQRLTRDSNAANLYSNAQSDQRFAPLRSVADFQKVLDKHKPPPK